MLAEQVLIDALLLSDCAALLYSASSVPEFAIWKSGLRLHHASVDVGHASTAKTIDWVAAHASLRLLLVASADDDGDAALHAALAERHAVCRRSAPAAVCTPALPPGDACLVRLRPGDGPRSGVGGPTPSSGAACSSAGGAARRSRSAALQAAAIVAATQAECAEARRAAGAPPCYTVPPGARGEGGRASTDDVAVIHDGGEAASAAAITQALEVAAAGAQALLIARGHPVLRDGLLHEGLHCAAFGEVGEVPTQRERLRSNAAARREMVRRARRVAAAQTHAWGNAADALAHVAYVVLKGAHYDERAAIFGQNTERLSP